MLEAYYININVFKKDCATKNDFGFIWIQQTLAPKITEQNSFRFS